MVARRIGAFAGLPIMASFVPFLLLPYIARVGGEAVWNALALGQAVGALAGIVVALGWTLSGPALVASTPTLSARRRLYAVSVATRLTMFTACVPCLALFAALAGPSQQIGETFLMSLAQAATGLSPAWFCVATGNAKAIARFDIIPRLVATLICIPALVATELIILFPASILAGSLVGYVIFSRRYSRLRDYAGLTGKVVLREIWSSRGAAGTTITAGAYASTPIVIVGAVALSPSLASFVAAERLYRVGLMAAGALGSSLQGWVSELGSNHAKRRRFSLLSHAVLGLAGLTGLSLLGPSVTRLLFGEELAADSATCLALGFAFLMVSVNTSTGSHWLVPMGKLRVVFWSTVAGAFSGVPAMLFLAWKYQAAGGAVGLAVGEFVVCSVQSLALWALYLRSKNRRNT